MSGDLRKVMSGDSRSKTPKLRNGRYHWENEIWHIAVISRVPETTLCFRECGHYIHLGPLEDHDLSDPHLCQQCYARAVK